MKLIEALFVLAACVAECHSKCPVRYLNITVDNIMELYIDGIEITGLPNYDNWKKADTVPLTGYTMVIAVKGTDLGVVAGILASTDDGFILTNSSWKCTNVYYAGWEQPDFDDSTWPQAYEAGIHQTSPWTLVPGIRTDAYWIWTPQFTGGNLVVYCRKELIPRELVCPTRNLSITVDNNVTKLYIDGVEQTNLPNANNWKRSDTIPLPCYAEVIAVQGTDDGYVRAGILASTPDAYVLTNASWKCTSVYYRGWETVAYNDLAWPQAHVVAIHQTYPWALVTPIRTDAYWIWTDSADIVVYCRIRLPARKLC